MIKGAPASLERLARPNRPDVHRNQGAATRPAGKPLPRGRGLDCAPLVLLLCLSGCTPTAPNELDKLGTVIVKAKELTVQAWIADETDERRKGLMFVTASEMAPISDDVERGMLFVFQRDQNTGFWMRNTIIDLDIAFIDAEKRIVRTFTMTALNEKIYSPGVMYRYAWEVNAGVFARESIAEGDQVEIPDSVLKRSK